LKQLLTSYADRFAARRSAHGVFGTSGGAGVSSERPSILILLGDMICRADFERPDMITLCVAEEAESFPKDAPLRAEISPHAPDDVRGRLLYNAVSMLYDAVLAAGRSDAFRRWDAVSVSIAAFAEDPLAALAPELAALIPELFGEQFLMVSQELMVLMDELGELTALETRAAARENAGRLLTRLDEIQSDGYVFGMRAYFPEGEREMTVEHRLFETVYLLGARRCDGRPVGIAQSLELIKLLPRLAFAGVGRAALTDPGGREGMSCVTAGVFPLEWPERYVWCKAFEDYAASLFTFDNDTAPVLPELVSAGVTADAVRQYADAVFGSVADIGFVLGGCLPVRQDERALEAAARAELSSAERLIFEDSLRSRFDSAYSAASFASVRSAAIQKARTQLRALTDTEDSSAAFASMRTLLEEDVCASASAHCIGEAERFSKYADSLEDSIEEAMRGEVFLQLDAPRSGFFMRRDSRRTVDALRSCLIEKVYSKRLELILMRQKALLLRELAAELDGFAADALAVCRRLAAFASEVSHIASGMEPAPIFDRELLDAYIAELLSQVQVPKRLPAGLHRRETADEMLGMLLESFEKPAAALFRLTDRTGGIPGFAAFCADQGRDLYSDAAGRLSLRDNEAFPVGCCYYSSTAELVSVDCIFDGGESELAARIAEKLPRCVRVGLERGGAMYLRLTGGFHLADVIYYRRSI